MSDFVLCLLKMLLVTAKRLTKNLYFVTTFNYSSGQDYPFYFYFSTHNVWKRETIDVLNDFSGLNSKWHKEQSQYRHARARQFQPQVTHLVCRHK